jgi:hypothetical protein
MSFQCASPLLFYTNDAFDHILIVQGPTLQITYFHLLLQISDVCVIASNATSGALIIFLDLSISSLQITIPRTSLSPSEK